MDKNPNMISVLEFSRRMGVGEKTIRDGIKSGKLVDGVIKVNGKSKILFEKAKKEFEDSGLGLKRILSNKPITKDQTKDKYTGYKEELNKIKHPSPAKEKEKVVPRIMFYENGDPIGGLDKNSSLKDAVRIEKIFKAQLAKLKVDEESKRLIDKEECYQKLYKFGLQVKSGIQSIPDRITDELISLSDDRDAFYSLLTKSIEDELKKLSQFKEEDL